MTTFFRAQNIACAAREGKAIYCSEVGDKPPGSPDCTLHANWAQHNHQPHRGVCYHQFYQVELARRLPNSNLIWYRKMFLGFGGDTLADF